MCANRDILNATRDGKLIKTGWTSASCKDMMLLFVMYIKPWRTSKQASKWQNVSDGCAGTDLRARGAEKSVMVTSTV